MPLLLSFNLHTHGKYKDTASGQIKLHTASTSVNLNTHNRSSAVKYHSFDLYSTKITKSVSFSLYTQI